MRLGIDPLRSLSTLENDCAKARNIKIRRILFYTQYYSGWWLAETISPELATHAPSLFCICASHKCF